MHRPKPLIATALALTFVLLAAGVSAQDTISLSISDPVIESFPMVQLFLQVRDGSGVPIGELPASAFSVLEDNQEAPDLIVEEVELGTRLVFALNTSPALRIRDTLGRSRYELVRNALLEWFALPEHGPLGVDEYSLITAEGIQLDRSNASADIASVLNNFPPTFEVEGDYELLFRAMDITNSPPPVVGMPSYIIFLTPLLRPSADVPIETIIARARSSQTAIYPVLIGPAEIVDQPEFEAFELLASETGGSVTYFDPRLGLLDLAQQIIAYRSQYLLTYRSLATASGPHEIRVSLSEGQLEAQSSPRSFVLELLEPRITLLNLPGGIERTSDDPGMPLENIPPTSQPIEFIVEFPDGYPRPIIQAQLLVDGAIADQRLEAPFSPLNWDLRDVLEDGTASIQVTVLDSLGYQATSMEAGIRYRVELPPRGLAAIRPAISSLLIALGVLLGGVALAAVLLTYGRRASPVMPGSKAQPQQRLTPISKLRQEIPDEPIEAYLFPLDGDRDDPGTIYLTGSEISIGRDPNFAAVPLEDPSVEGLHARIFRQVDGTYIVRDQGSKSGTWIHYQEIPAAGQKLQHGDIVHFGRSGFRFAFLEAPPDKEIRITRPGKLDEATEEPSS